MPCNDAKRVRNDPDRPHTRAKPEENENFRSLLPRGGDDEMNAGGAPKRLRVSDRPSRREGRLPALRGVCVCVVE